MKPIILMGTVAITLSLILYSIGMLSAMRKKLITKKVLWLLTIGLISEVTAVACMALGSTKPLTTPHGLVGLAGIIIMIGVVTVSWKKILRGMGDYSLTGNFYLFYVFAYGLWVMAYISGAMTGLSQI